MSMDLYVWKAPVTDDPDEAKTLLERYLDSEDKSAFEPSPAIASMADELLKLYPTRVLRGEEALEAMSDKEREGCRDIPIDQVTMIQSEVPWTEFPLFQTDRLLILGMGWSVASEFLEDVERLAREHDLMLYDPQGPEVYPPGEPFQPGPDYEPGAMAYVKAFGFIAIFAGLTYGAWLIPFGWLRWPLVVIGLFLVAAALMAAWACVAADLEQRSGKPAP
jgi:hypothetical protein